MRYLEFKAVIRKGLQASPDGLTWKELRDQLELPYERPCPEWTKRLEKEIGLDRNEKKGRASLWRIK